MIYLFYSIYLILSANASEVILYPGLKEQITVGSGNVQIERKGIVEIRDSGRYLQLIGKKIGSTKITTRSSTTEIHVLSQKNYKTYFKLKEWSRKKLGPILLIENALPVISGKILVLEDWLELKESMSAEDQYISRPSVDDKLELKIHKDLEQTLQRHQLPFSDLVLDGPWKIYLNKKQASEIDNYKKILQPLGIQVATSQFVVSGIPMVEINIVAAEVNKKDMSQLGVSWPDKTSLQPFADQIIAKDSWSLTIHHMEQKGWGKVLASPTLVTQSGEEATFHSGGEMPIRTANQFNTSVIWKKYGIIMKIKPLVDFKGNIDVMIECEVSMIDGSTVVDGAPGLLINKITSHFNLQESRTIALSGLIKEQWAKGRVGLPGIKDIPIFGNLFSSQNYLNHRSELMFFVTPKILK
ncbi:MAG: type II and III secretion system protein [Bdellovibrionaceae bacterium]|nr:type II and III secretion system protein [Pseudobdellovibrionaceae bacterium]